jgi:hypothetical protein
MVNHQRAIFPSQRGNKIFPVSNGGHGVEEGSIFISKSSPTCGTTFFPVILLTQKQKLQLIFNYIAKIPFCDVQNSLFLHAVKSQNDLIAISNDIVQHSKSIAPFFKTFTQELELG